MGMRGVGANKDDSNSAWATFSTIYFLYGFPFQGKYTCVRLINWKQYRFLITLIENNVVHARIFLSYSHKKDGSIWDIMDERIIYILNRTR